MAASMADGRSWARDGIQAAAVTYVIAVTILAMPGLTCCATSGTPVDILLTYYFLSH